MLPYSTDTFIGSAIVAPLVLKILDSREASSSHQLASVFSDASHDGTDVGSIVWLATAFLPTPHLAFEQTRHLEQFRHAVMCSVIRCRLASSLPHYGGYLQAALHFLITM